MVYNFQLVDENIWGIDSNAYFKGGKGFWAKAGNSVQEFKITADTFGARTVSLHVRTGDSGSSTNMVASYALEFDGSGIPLTLDQSRPPEWKPDIFGGAWMGYLNGTISIDEKVEKIMKLKVSAAFSAYDALLIGEPSGSGGGGSYDEGYIDGDADRKVKDQNFLNDMFALPE